MNIYDKNLNNLQLDEQLCFALYNATNSITRLYRKLLGKYNLTYPQYLVLIVLWGNDAISVTELMHKLNLETGTISPILQRLERAGLITKQRQPKDHRSVVICLTQHAKDLKPHIAEVQRKVACSTKLSPDVFHELIDSLNKLTSDIQRFER